MVYLVNLPGSIKSKKNSKRIVIAGKMRKIVPSRAYLQWEKEARGAARTQYKTGPLPCNLEVTVQAYYRGPRPDLSGVLESVGDAMEGILWENDRQIISWDGSRIMHCPDNPRTLLIIYTIENSVINSLQTVTGNSRQ